VTSLRTNIEVLAESDPEPAERARVIADVQAQAEELSALVGDLIENVPELGLSEDVFAAPPAEGGEPAEAIVDPEAEVVPEPEAEVAEVAAEPEAEVAVPEPEPEVAPAPEPEPEAEAAPEPEPEAPAEPEAEAEAKEPGQSA
jgi:hypothetical protein